jgi:hypothetical protein
MVKTSYTYSKWMSNNDASLGEGGTGQSSQRPQDMFDYEAEWSRSQFDRPHRLAVSYIWEIPGPRTGVDSNGDSTDAGLSDRPNINTSGSFVWDDDHKSFTNNGYYTVPLGSNNLPLQNSLGNGNAPRNSERGAAFWNTDMSLMKRFDLPGTVLFQVRVDAFNLFNQDNYGAPVSSMSSTSFGLNTNNFGRRIIQLGGKFTF